MTGNPRNDMVSDTPYLQHEFSNPRFFYVFNLILSFSTSSQSFKKICAWELLGTNVLKTGTANNGMNGNILLLFCYYFQQRGKELHCGLKSFVSLQDQAPVEGRCKMSQIWTSTAATQVQIKIHLFLHLQIINK